MSINTIIVKFAVLVALNLAGVRNVAGPQMVAVDTSAARLAKAVRSNGKFESAARVLTTTSKSVSESTRNEIADSLVSVVIRPGVLGDAQSERSFKAIQVLRRSARRLNDQRRYDGAVAKLLRIAQEAPDSRSRNAATFAIGQAADTASALRALRTIAVSSDTVAYAAVEELQTTFGKAGGESILRELWVDRTVVNLFAKDALERLARVKHW